LDTSKKLIYPSNGIAAMIAGKLTKTKGLKHDVYKVTTGFQVVPVTVCQDYMPPKKPLPVMDGATLKKLIKDKAQAGGDVLTFTFKFRGESAVYIDIWMEDGSPKSFGKSNLIDWEVSDDKATVVLQITKAIAKKRGLI
jgi:hypothetical protein